MTKTYMAYTDTFRSTQLYTLSAYRSVVYSVLLYPLPVHSQNNDPQRFTETNMSLRLDLVYLYIVNKLWVSIQTLTNLLAASFRRAIRSLLAAIRSSGSFESTEGPTSSSSPLELMISSFAVPNNLDGDFVAMPRPPLITWHSEEASRLRYEYFFMIQ